MSNKNRKSSDNLIRNILIVFGSIFTILIVSLIIFNVTSEELKYSDFKEVKSYNEISTIQDQKYLLYFYSESCGACQSIKTQSLNFFNENEKDLPVYMIDANRISGTKDSLDLPESKTLTSTPTLMVVENGIIIKFLVGTEEIALFYNEFQ